MQMGAKRDKGELSMNYPFVCNYCNNKETISMPIKEYVVTGHKCPKCGNEMVREISSLVCGVGIDKTGGFYKHTTI
jgi:predicted nucleic acid-binding Zn ribbon protein